MESSSSSAYDRFVSSPRAQRRLIWVSSVIFAAGLIAFLSAYLLRGSAGAHSPISNQAAQTTPKTVKVPPSKEAFKVARQFVMTAPLRKNLDVAYDLVGPSLKEGMTRKQWDTGNIPVIDYPAENAKTSAFQVDWSYKTEMMLEVTLVAKKGSGKHIRPSLGFYLGLDRAGGKPNGKWQVTTWMTTWHPPLPNSPQ
jgi:uncharacterized protein YcnI